MQTHFVELQLSLATLPTPQHVETVLSAWGKPLRWAITKVVADCYHLEAIVTINDA